MIRHLLSPPWPVFWFCPSNISSRAFAQPETDVKHLNPFLDGQKGAYMHGRGMYEKRKRSGRNSLVNRCNASERSRDSKTPASSQDSSHPPASPRNGSWHGPMVYLANFARPKGRWFEYPFIFYAAANAILGLYTWNPHLPSAGSNLGLECIPILWGWDQVDACKSVVVKCYAKSMFATYHRRQNEPSQFNMCPRDGISSWKQCIYIDPLKSEGYYFISPACTNDQAGLNSSSTGA